MTIKKLFIALISCALSSAVFLFYSASTIFMKNSSPNQQEELNRLEAFIEASRTHIEPSVFWERIFESWLYGFGLAFLACFLFVALNQILTPNKSSKKDVLEHTSS